MLYTSFHEVIKAINDRHPPGALLKLVHAGNDKK